MPFAFASFFSKDAILFVFSLFFPFLFYCFLYSFCFFSMLPLNPACTLSVFLFSVSSPFLCPTPVLSQPLLSSVFCILTFLYRYYYVCFSFLFLCLSQFIWISHCIFFTFYCISFPFILFSCSNFFPIFFIILVCCNYFSPLLFIFIRAVGSTFTVRGLSKKVGRHGWPTLKNWKEKHWLKRHEAVAEKTKFGPKYKSLKISYLKLFFWKYFFGHTTFLYLSFRSSGHHRVFFFNFRFFSRKSQSQQKLPKKITHFSI